MKKVVIGGVPEHFNFPWNLAIEEGLFEREGITLKWKDFPAGTGALNEALRNKELDLAVILTEGIVKDIADSNPSQIVQVYVHSPLLWGIHVAHDSIYQNIEELKGTKAAISRYGSGSHLMAIVNAEKHGWDLDSDLNFHLVEDLEGALEALPKGEADYFMWEKFMTKPFVDNGTFRLIGETPTPWPSFVIVGQKEFLENESETLESILKIINSKTESFKEIHGIENMIAERFNQKSEDVEKWLKLTSWSKAQLTEQQLDHVQNTLIKLNLSKQKQENKRFLFSPTAPH